MMVPDVWSQQEAAGDLYDIYELEAIGPALALHDFSLLLGDCCWFHFIGNACALAILVKGSSSVLGADAIAAYTSEGIARLSLWTWLDRVDSGSNPVDGFSRADVEGYWELRDIFPQDFMDNSKSYLAQSFSTTR